MRYGRIDLTVENNNNGTLSRTLIQNFSSRLGIKGERKFGDDLSGIFQVETGVAPDDAAQSKTFASPSLHWVKMTVNPAAEQLFVIEPVIIEHSR